MMLKPLWTAMLLTSLLSCTGYDNHQLKVEKIRESVNAVKFSVSLTGDDLVQCTGTIKYNDFLMHRFRLESHKTETPSEFLINYSEFPGLAQQLATDFVLKRNPNLEIGIVNREEDFSRMDQIDLNPAIPPIMTGIDVISKDITRKYPIGFAQEVYEIESYLMENNITLNNYTREKIATVSLLIKNNSKILLTVVPAGDAVPVYKGKKHIDVSVLMDSMSFNPFLTLFPSKTNKYYDGPNLYEIADAHYTREDEYFSPINLKTNKFVIEERFDVENLIGEYNLFLVISKGVDDYFYYDLGSVIFDNVAPEFNEVFLGNYYFGGNNKYEGKVYLDYSIPFSQNPYEVIFSGKIFGDVKDLSVDGTKIDIYGKSDIIFSKKIYIREGYKDVKVKITDLAGNLKNYSIPLIVGN
ncbi:hypothetical protein ACFLSS_04130 [Bacteroidota bacterium]